jgi:hypothetical protein
MKMIITLSNDVCNIKEEYEIKKRDKVVTLLDVWIQRHCHYINTSLASVFFAEQLLNPPSITKGTVLTNLNNEELNVRSLSYYKFEIEYRIKLLELHFRLLSQIDNINRRPEIFFNVKFEEDHEESNSDIQAFNTLLEPKVTSLELNVL